MNTPPVWFTCLAGTHDFCAPEWKKTAPAVADATTTSSPPSSFEPDGLRSPSGACLACIPHPILPCRPARRAEHQIFDNSLDFGPKQKVSGGVSAFSRTVLLRSISVERIEGKGYRSRHSIAGAASRIVLARKERAMIRMVADCASPQFIAQRLELEEMQLRAALDSVFAKLAMSGRLGLLSRKGW
jgi:DNA-binding CsgD family transcriptional regulator